MKKLLTVILAAAILLSLCACAAPAQQEETQAVDAPEASTAPQPTTPPITEEKEDPLKNVNEMEPVDGVYQIVSVKGLENLAKYPDAKFALLKDIDLQGADWMPVENFTGQLDGGYFTISNFTIETPTADGAQGLIGVNKGMIKNLLLTNVTVKTADKTLAAGAFAGVNEGTILRCTAGGTMTAAAGNASLGGAAGINRGSVRNSTCDVDITASAGSNIGSLVGQQEGGSLEFSTGSGYLKVTGAKGKNVGLICGSAKNAEVKGSLFLGEENTLDGQLFIDFVGSKANATVKDCRYRDNSAPEVPENIRALRQQAVDAMYEMATVEWYVSEPLHHSCTCTLAACHGMWQPGMLHKGMPYIHKGGSLARFQYCLDENSTLKDWIYKLDTFDGFDMYIGNDCSTALQMAYAKVGNSFNFLRCTYQLPYYRMGCLPVGDWEWDMAPADSRGWTAPYCQATGEERMYEAYAQLLAGDSVVFINAEGGHTRMVSQDAVVVRDENGKIDPTNSYILCHQQGGVTVQVEPYYTTWGLDNRFTFQALWRETSLPITIQEFQDGIVDEPEAVLENGGEGRVGLYTGVVKSNYHLDSVTLVLTDAQGQELLNKQMFTAVGKTADANSNDTLIRCMIFEYDLAHFAAALQQTYLDPAQEYHYTITAHLSTGDDIVVKEASC